MNSGNSSDSIHSIQKKRTILIIDDEPMIVMILNKALSDFGYQILTASSYSEGLDQARLGLPDLILLDVMLQDGSGLDLCGEIKSDPKLKHIQVILMSGVRITPVEQALGLNAGADDYVAKPLHYREIIARIESLLRIKRVEEELRKSEKRYRSLFDSMLNAFFLCKALLDKHGGTYDFIYIDLNPSFESITGLNHQNVIGRSIRDVLPGIDQDIMNSFVSVVETGGSSRFEGYVRELGKHFEFLAYRPEKNHLAVNFWDITQRKNAEDQLRILATTDELTKLWNRRYFMQTVHQEMERGKRYDKTFSLMLLDIDHFKKINDVYGHAAGDKALEYIATVIKNHLRQVDVPCRFGGEEFAVLLPHTNIDEAYQIAERLRIYVQNNPANYLGQDIFFTVSIGLVQYRQGISNEDELLKMADDALYQAKRNGRNLTVKADSGSKPE